MPPEKTPEHQMQPHENRSKNMQKDDDNQAGISSPSMHPRPQPKPKNLTPEQKRAQQQAQQRSRQVIQQIAERAIQEWRVKNAAQRIKNTMCKDTKLRNALFADAKRIVTKDANIPFVHLSPQAQLRVLTIVGRALSNLARNGINSVQKSQPNLNDVTNPNNQADPNNWVNQQQAINQSIIDQQNSEQAQVILTADDQVASEQLAEDTIAENTTATMTLTAAEEEAITTHNQVTFSPSPKPGSQPDDKALKEGEKALLEDGIAKAVFEHKGEEQALKGFMEGDKKALINGLKGGVEESAEKAGLQAGMRLAAGAA